MSLMEVLEQCLEADPWVAELNPWEANESFWRQKYAEIAALYGVGDEVKYGSATDALGDEVKYGSATDALDDDEDGRDEIAVLFDGPCPHPEYLGIWDDGRGRGVRVTWDGVFYTAAPCRSDDTSLTFLNVLNAKPSDWAPPDEWVLIEPAAPESAEPYEPKPKTSMRIPWDPYPDGAA